ncbi:MAG: FecCD family ABC transporter permease [Promethearchaeota archaeon]
MLSIFFAISFGKGDIYQSNYDFPTIFSMILYKLGFPVNVTWSVADETIIMVLRMPRVLMAVVIGAMLGIAGVAAQGLFRNPIADPYIIGISAAAGCGTALSVLIGLNAIFLLFTRPLISFIFSILAVIIVYKLSKTRYQMSVIVLLLAGIAISFIFSSITSLLLYFSEDKVHYILYFLMGRLWASTWDEIFIVYLVLVPCIIIMFFYGRDLNVMVFGDEVAQSMGVNIEKSKKVILILMTLLTSTAVAFCGSIGFVGLIIPHIMRILVGNDNRKLIPLSALSGGLLLIWADLLSRSLVPPLEIPVGIFTSLMGAPFFIYLIVQKKKSGEIF